MDFATIGSRSGIHKLAPGPCYLLCWCDRERPSPGFGKEPFQGTVVQGAIKNGCFFLDHSTSHALLRTSKWFVLAFGVRVIWRAAISLMCAL